MSPLMNPYKSVLSFRTLANLKIDQNTLSGSISDLRNNAYRNLPSHIPGGLFVEHFESLYPLQQTEIPN